MTHTNEQERAEFEAWTESVGLDHLDRGFGKENDYAFVETRRMWVAWQAARRAPVVPWGVEDSVAEAIYEADKRMWLTSVEYQKLHDDDKGRLRAMARAALASAPQPPEAEPQHLWKDVKYDNPDCREARMVVIERDSIGKPTVWCDPEIVDVVRALNANGVRTIASCSGHGHLPGTIILRDGRCIIICDDLEQMRNIISKCFDVDVNGQKKEAAPVQMPELESRIDVIEVAKELKDNVSAFGDTKSKAKEKAAFYLVSQHEQILYWQHQVRQLLAQHGIK